MKRLIAIAAPAVLLAACAGQGGPEGGVASYDALRKATTDCQAKGGKLVLKDQGDAQYIGDYACVRN